MFVIQVDAINIRQSSLPSFRDSCYPNEELLETVLDTDTTRKNDDLFGSL